MLILLLICAMASCERPGSKAKYVSIRILDEPKYLDIELSVADYGVEIYRRPRDVFYIGKVKQSVLDTSDSFSSGEFYVEYHGTIGEIEGIHHYLNEDSVNHIYLALDKSVGLEVLNRIHNCRYDLLLHIVHSNHIGGNNETYLHRGRCTERYVLGKTMGRHSDYLGIEGDVCTFDGRRFANCDSVMRAIVESTMIVDEKNTCFGCAFNTWKLERETIKDELQGYIEQLRRAKKYGVDTCFFAGELNQWKEIESVFNQSEDRYIYVPSHNGMIIIGESPSNIGSEYYKFAHDCLAVRRESWADHLNIKPRNVPSLLMRPEIYYGDWRVVDYPLMRLYDYCLSDVRINYPPPTIEGPIESQL